MHTLMQKLEIKIFEKLEKTKPTLLLSSSSFDKIHWRERELCNSNNHGR
jgi:hypothetical protein